jgi:Mn-dependent DtxR family transcriptional regulator
MNVKQVRRTTQLPILEIINREGFATPKLLYNELDKSEGYIRQELLDLNDNDYIERVDRGVYQLTERGEKALKHKDLIGSPAFDKAINN